VKPDRVEHVGERGARLCKQSDRGAVEWGLCLQTVTQLRPNKVPSIVLVPTHGNGDHRRASGIYRRVGVLDDREHNRKVSGMRTH